jgi:hypothetical protein
VYVVEPRFDAYKRFLVVPDHLAQLHRPIGAVQLKNRFATSAQHMDMRWNMIVGVNDNPKVVDAMNCWHCAYPNRLGFFVKPYFYPTTYVWRVRCRVLNLVSAITKEN